MRCPLLEIPKHVSNTWFSSSPAGPSQAMAATARMTQNQATRLSKGVCQASACLPKVRSMKHRRGTHFYCCTWLPFLGRNLGQNVGQKKCPPTVGGHFLWPTLCPRFRPRNWSHPDDHVDRPLNEWDTSDRPDLFQLTLQYLSAHNTSDIASKTLNENNGTPKKHM